MLRVLTALPFALLLFSGPARPADTDAETLKERARTILARPAYQKEMIEQDQEWGLIQGSEALESPRGMGPLGQLLLYVGLGLMAGFVLVWLVAYSRGRGEEKAGASSSSAAPDEGGSIVPHSLQEAEALARAGRFGEAVHLLLLLAVSHLSARRKGFTPRDLTGRELLRALPGNEEERGAFRRLVAAAELYLFGGRPVSEASYRACLESYKGLAR